MALLSQSSFLQASVHLLPRSLMLPPLPIKHLSTCQKPLSSVSMPNSKKLRFITLASVSPPTLTSKNTQTPTQSLITESTQTLRMLLSLTLSACMLFAKALQKLALRISHSISLKPDPQELAAIQSLQGNLLCAAGPLFFAAMRSQRSGHLNTPLTVVAVGLAKWLDIYGGLVMVRVLLSWFPSIPWERQPLSAIRDLCDPFLNLFRNIIPPIFGTLDVSPLLAFAVMGVLGSILKNSTKV
ncbi:hypothetical protein SLEP1_g522 [Rubroshorea leprosula]|uniref:YGGT family protein n=1 Tax=Rubroshorea leprosula TaxID=152421 RepID=A0AAV5HAR6_9ROSI|nr:hypothetical protein SLEP1_g522 [Rubroshorea leprosula]